MKLLFATALVALVGLTTANRVFTNVYPCPHSGTTRLAHASSCSQFVQCVNGVAVEEDCASGLFFSAETQQCTTATLANCHVEKKPCPTWTDPENLVFLTNGGNCNNYFLCFDGEPISMECASGYTFNSATNQCDSAQCSVPRWSCNSYDNVRHPDDDNCGRFYHCVNGVQYGGECGQGLLFDAVTSRCVEPSRAYCGSFTSVGPTVTTPNPTVSCEPTCTTPTYSTEKTTTPKTTTEKTTTTKKTTTEKTTTPKTTTEKTTTTPKTTTEKTTTTKKTTTEKTTTEKTTTEKTTTPKTTTTKKTTTEKTTTTTPAPELNLDSFCKISEVGRVAVVNHPERCDWYITCTYGHGTLGKCGSFQIFSQNKGRCVLGNANTCKVLDEINDDMPEDTLYADETGLQ